MPVRYNVTACPGEQWDSSKSSRVLLLLLIRYHHIKVKCSNTQFDCSRCPSEFFLIINKVINILKITAFTCASFLKLQTFLFFDCQVWLFNLGHSLSILIQKALPLLIGHLPYELRGPYGSHVVEDATIVHAVYQRVGILHILKVLKAWFTVDEIVFASFSIYRNPSFLIENFVKVVFVGNLALLFELHVARTLRILRVLKDVTAQGFANRALIFEMTSWFHSFENLVVASIHQRGSALFIGLNLQILQFLKLNADIFRLFFAHNCIWSFYKFYFCLLFWWSGYLIRALADTGGSTIFGRIYWRRLFSNVWAFGIFTFSHSFILRY